MIMNNEELNLKLYEKMSAEQDKYRDWLLTQPPVEILRHTYEYTVREDIVMSLEMNNLTDEQASALLASPSPLSDVCDTFMDMEVNHMDDIRDSITNRADDVLKRQREELLNTPVYKHPASYARENNELDIYRASNKANISCKEALEKAINGNYRDNCLDTKTAYAQVAEQFGAERMKYVLAVTVREKDWDGRISHDNKEWASTVPVAENPDAWGSDRNCYMVVDQAHPGLVDLFVTRARKEFAKELDAPDKKPSVLGKLQKAAAEPKAPMPSRKKDMEL